MICLSFLNFASAFHSSPVKERWRRSRRRGVTARASARLKRLGSPPISLNILHFASNPLIKGHLL
jgi:hypothetical protein